MMVDVAQPSVPNEPSLSHIMTGVLSEVAPQRAVAEPESSNREEPDNASTVFLEENIEESHPIDESAEKPTKQLIEKPTVHTEEKEVQMIKALALRIEQKILPSSLYPKLPMP